MRSTKVPKARGGGPGCPQLSRDASSDAHGHSSSMLGSGYGQSWSLPHGLWQLVEEGHHLDACAMVVEAGGRMVPLHGSA